MNLDAAVNKLYRLKPTEFVAARTRLVEQVEASGDRPLARSISTLKRPTIAAWTLNLLVRDDRQGIENLLHLGNEIGDATRRLSASELRELSSRRQDAVRTLTARAGQLAADCGHPVNESVRRDVAQTLGACLAVPEAAEELRRGRLLTAVRYSGFGSTGLSLVTDPEVEDAGPVEAEPAPPEASDPVDVDEVEAALADARAREVDARARLVETRARVSEVMDRITNLRRTLESAEQEGQFAIHAREDAQTQLAALECEIAQTSATLRALRRHRAQQ